jgi:hypothetical protein
MGIYYVLLISLQSPFVRRLFDLSIGSLEITHLYPDLICPAR